MFEFDEENIKQNKFDEVLEFKKRKEFSTREVGITHPDNNGFIRVADSGEIEIFAAPGVGLVINPSTRAISIFADSIKFYSKENDGLRWNEMSFNPSADTYNEPAFVKTSDFSNNPAYYNTSYYLDNLDQLDQLDSVNPVTIIGDYGLGGNSIPGTFTPAVESNISSEEESLLREYAKTNSDSSVFKIKELLELGYSFSEAVQKIKDNNFNDAENLENFPWIHNDLDE
jgi:hypothetical protein